MSSEIARRVQSNIVKSETTLGQDVGVFAAKAGVGAMLLPFLSILPFVSLNFFFWMPIGMVLVVMGTYMRYGR